MTHKQLLWNVVSVYKILKNGFMLHAITNGVENATDKCNDTIWPPALSVELHGGLDYLICTSNHYYMVMSQLCVGE